MKVHLARYVFIGKYSSGPLIIDKTDQKKQKKFDGLFLFCYVLTEAIYFHALSSRTDKGVAIQDARHSP